MSMEKGTVNDGLEQKTDDVTVETATEQKDAAAAASAEQGAVGTPAKKSKKKYIIAAYIVQFYSKQRQSGKLLSLYCQERS